MNTIHDTVVFFKRLTARFRSYIPTGICFGRTIAHAPRGAVVFFPYRPKKMLAKSDRSSYTSAMNGIGMMAM